MNERRSAQRRPVFIVASLHCEGKRRVALCRDANEKSVLIGCSRPASIGEKVALELDLSGAHKKVIGRVVRCERNREAEISLWRYLLAVELEDVDPALQRFLTAEEVPAPL